MAEVKSEEKKRPGRPRKYATDAERKAAKYRQTNQSQKENQKKHKRENQYRDQLAYHQRTGYAAQKRWKERKKEQDRLRQLATIIEHPPQASTAPTPQVPHPDNPITQIAAPAVTPANPAATPQRVQSPQISTPHSNH